MVRVFVWIIVAGVLAALPASAGAADVTQGDWLAPLQGAVSDLYSYSLTIVGLCVFIMFLIAGLRYIIPDSMWPKALSAFNDPVETIKNAIIGMILLFSAYLILNTINPALVGNTTQPASQTQPLTP